MLNLPFRKRAVASGPGLGADDDLELVCIGHSHTGALVTGSETARGGRFKVLNFWSLPGAVEGTQELPALRKDIAAQLKPPLISMMGGGAQTVLSLGRHPRPFDFILPEEANLPLEADVEIVPYDAIRERLIEDWQPFWRLTELVASLVDGPVFHVDSPPPISDPAFIAPHIPWDFFPGRLHEVAPRYHRYRMWRLNTLVMQDYCRKTGIGFICHPPESEDSDGFLQEPFSDDGIHGNACYGALLSNKIRRVILDGEYEPGDIRPTMNGDEA